MIILTAVWRINYRGVRYDKGVNQCVALKMVRSGSRAVLKDLLMDVCRGTIDAVYWHRGDRTLDMCNFTGVRGGDQVFFFEIEV